MKQINLSEDAVWAIWLALYVAKNKERIGKECSTSQDTIDKIAEMEGVFHDMITL